MSSTRTNADVATSSLVEKVARIILGWSHEAATEEWTDYEEASKAAIAVVLKELAGDSSPNEITMDYLQAIARENGIDLNDR